MRLRSLHLQDFRNIAEAHLDLEGPAHFFVGANGQGKTNLLESVSLLTALRSFRTRQLRQLPRQGGQGTARILCQLEHEQRGETQVELSLGAASKRIQVDGEAVRRLSDFVGLFPVVALASDDILLLRGEPERRRRFLDLVLSAGDPGYFRSWRRYATALAERNLLLRRGASPGELGAFEAALAPEAARLMQDRQQGLQDLAQRLIATYTLFAPEAEAPDLVYAPDVEETEPEALRVMWERNRATDRERGTTQRGPHRDDFHLCLRGSKARDYGSEGQQRGLVLSLRLAEAAQLGERLGRAPVLLADDVLGELDAQRRVAFWRGVRPEWQVLASGTAVAPREGDRGWVRWSVADGSFVRHDST